MAPEMKLSLLVNLCGLLMEEVGMPSTAVKELGDRASAKTTTELESFQSVMVWMSATANFYDPQEIIAMGLFKPRKEEYSRNLVAPVSDPSVAPVSSKPQIPDHSKPPIPDLNEPAPQGEIQDIGKAVEAEASTTAGKRKITEANHSVKKRSKFTQDSVGPATGDKGKGVPKMESWGEN